METPPPYIVLFLTGTLIIIVIALALLFILILINQKRQRHFQESISALQLEHEKHILKTQVEIQEQTLEHISWEIHDNIGQSLTLAKLNLNTMNRNNPQSINESVANSIDHIEEAMADLRDVSHSLNSEVIKNQGLLKALETEIQRISRSTQLQVDMSVSGEPVYLPSEKELFIFRIIQEALNNVVKHAKASSVNLHLFYTDQQVQINIKDDGAGFDMVKVKAMNGSAAGLTNMEKRAKLFKGSFHLQSEKKKAQN